MLKTLGGSPPLDDESAESEHEGDHSAGLRIIVEPAASERSSRSRVHERCDGDHDGVPLVSDHAEVVVPSTHTRLRSLRGRIAP
jgi:hypothetical protein